MNQTQIKLADSWLKPLKAEFDQPYMQDLSAFLRTEKNIGKVVYPKGNDIFNALNDSGSRKNEYTIQPQSLRLEASVEIVAEPPDDSHKTS